MVTHPNGMRLPLISEHHDASREDLIAELMRGTAMAHAMVRAMNEWGIDEFGVVDALKSRADEIMAGWGYREVDDGSS